MLETKRDGLSLANLLRPELRANPYTFYAEIRSQDPVHWDEQMGFWALARYADVAAAFRDVRFSRARGLEGAFARLPESEQERAEPVYRMFSQFVTYTDPPYHARLRGLANKAFTPRVVEMMRAHIEKVVEDLLARIQPGETVDLIQQLAYPLPLTVIMELVGVPLSEREHFKQWSDDLFAVMGVVRHDPQVITHAAQSLSESTEYMCALYEQAHRNTGDDLFSALVRVSDEEGTLSREEVISNTIGLIGAGHETTTNLIGNGVLALLQHPDELEKLKADPSLIAGAVEEMLRYDNPVQIVYRVAAEDVEVGGKCIRTGDIVNLLVGSANRDEAQFADPDRFDVTRSVERHVGFGLGIHFCLGAPLARLEAQIALPALLRRFPNMQLASDKLEWHEHPTFHGLQALPVAL